METKTASSFWWVKPKQPTVEENGNNPSLTIPRLDLDISSSLADFLEKEQNALNSNKDDNTDVDVGSIIEEINRVAAQSPLGPFDQNKGERSIEDIMKEAERIYLESSKSFEQLSQRSKTSLNLTDLNSSHAGSTPTPKSVSPLPLDPGKDSDHSDTESYSEDFSEESRVQSNPSPVNEKLEEEPIILKNQEQMVSNNNSSPTSSFNKSSVIHSPKKQETFISNQSINNAFKDSGYLLSQFENEEVNEIKKHSDLRLRDEMEKAMEVHTERLNKFEGEIRFKNDLIKTLDEDNKLLRSDIRDIKLELQQTNSLLEKTRAALQAKSVSSPEISLELEKVLENLKDSQEINTALQLQLDGLNKTHQHLKTSYEDLVSSNKNLERRVLDLDNAVGKYKSELLNVQQTKDKLLENELSLNKLLEIEKLQSKSLKLQNDKDARCIQDLNRQIKEMERIIARKHPDSVSALIVAAKNDATDSNLTARKVLEDRIRTLEQEACSRDTQSSKVFLDIQEKFNLMKLKYESHIDDLELHVNDLKTQLKRSVDTFDVYTQTVSFSEQKIPEKDTFTVTTQTDAIVSKPATKVIAVKRHEKSAEVKEDAHLIATIRGLQADLSNKEKVSGRLQKEVDELRKTNRRLQKEREGSLRNLSDKREFRSYPEKLASHNTSRDGSDSGSLDEELRMVKNERDKMKQQLCRLEEDYQVLKSKRLHDLNVLQEAHEREISNYVSGVSPLREQLEMQQVSISTLQSQLSGVKEELAIVTVERDHLSNRILNSDLHGGRSTVCRGENLDVEPLVEKIAFLEKRYEEREHRLRAIVHGLAQKNVTNRSCEQCADRQKQLIGYKIELDQLLATLRALK